MQARTVGARVQGVSARTDLAPRRCRPQDALCPGPCPTRIQRLCAPCLRPTYGHAWLGDHLDSLTLQKRASRAYGAANRLLLGTARRVRFKGRHQLDTVEGKTNNSGIRWCQDPVECTD